MFFNGAKELDYSPGTLYICQEIGHLLVTSAGCGGTMMLIVKDVEPLREPQKPSVKRVLLCAQPSDTPHLC